MSLCRPGGSFLWLFISPPKNTPLSQNRVQPPPPGEKFGFRLNAMFPWQSCREVRAHGMGLDSRSKEVTGKGERLVTHWWRRRRNWRYKNEWVEERSFVKHPA